MQKYVHEDPRRVNSEVINVSSSLDILAFAVFMTQYDSLPDRDARPAA